jgi:hypothetical protein
MLPTSRDQRTDDFTRGGASAIALTVLHYLISAFAIAFGSLGFILGLLAWVFDVESPGFGWLGWITMGAILLGEIIYRPAFKLTAGLGFLALLLLCLLIAANFLVSRTF